MIEPRPAVTRFVEAVARAELARGATDAGVAQGILEQLHRELGKLIGSLAFDVLLGRALVLARRAHPALATVTVEPAAKLVGVDGARREESLAIVAHFIELLVVLIGEDLAMRLVEDAWPTVEVEEEKR